MAPESRTRWNPYNNLLANLTREQDELANLQGLAGRSDTNSNKALTPLEVFALLFVPYTKNFFTKFIKVFIKLT